LKTLKANTMISKEAEVAAGTSVNVYNKVLAEII
jgi:hypothetical protein